MTPEDRARGHDYISATAAATAAKQTGVASPSYRVVTQNDGTKVYEVLDAAGKVVYSNTDEDLAQAAYTDTVTAFTTAADCRPSGRAGDRGGGGGRRRGRGHREALGRTESHVGAA